MTKLSKTRANDYRTLIYICIILINLYHRKIITRGQIYDLFDVFSSKADSYDPSGVEKAIDTNISIFDGKGYGIKYLKEDDNDYYL